MFSFPALHIEYLKVCNLHRVDIMSEEGGSVRGIV